MVAVYHNKKVLKAIAIGHGLSLSKIDFVGDDVIVFSFLESASPRSAPSDVRILIKDKVVEITIFKGRDGVVRDVYEYIICGRGISLSTAYKPLLDRWSLVEVAQ